MNRYETDAVRQAFAAKGFRVLDDSEDADIFVINTCTVTAEADRKSRQMIRRARRRNPAAIVVAMGCQVELLKSASEADVSIGTQNRITVVDKVLERLGMTSSSESCADALTAAKAVRSEDAPGSPADSPEHPQYQEFGPVLSQEETRAYIKIEDGCNNFCSYCIIPYARGRVVSRAPEDVIREANELASRGFHEIVLTGIHICSFGKDRGEDISALADLLDELDRIPQIHRIRLGSLEPNSLTEDFIIRISAMRKICPHFHISLQSGSDGVLHRMNRRYGAAEYRTCISNIRRYFPEAAITTDVIVGFPTETDEEHLESLRFCREMAFSRIHVFPFSERKGTKAAELSPKVPPEKKTDRRDEFLLLSEELSALFCGSLVGKTTAVLLETKDEDGGMAGYTAEYVRVRVKSEPDISQGMEAKVFIDSFADGELFGRITSKSSV